MAKIGRNEKCPCLSGRKYKHCCGKGGRQPAPSTPEQGLKVTLMKGVRNIQDDALSRRKLCRELGVFFFFSTSDGDAWLMEMTDCDCVQVARDGVALDPPIDETSETIEINWSHSYQFVDRQLELTDYADKSRTILESAPTSELNGAMRRIRKRFSDEQLNQVHLRETEAEKAE